MKMVWLQWSHLKWRAILDIHAQFLDITFTSGFHMTKDVDVSEILAYNASP